MAIGQSLVQNATRVVIRRAFLGTSVLGNACRAASLTHHGAFSNRLSVFGEDLLGHPHGGVGGGDAGIDGDVHQEFGDVFGGGAGVSGGAEVELELLLVAEGGEQGEGDDRSGAVVENAGGTRWCPRRPR